MNRIHSVASKIDLSWRYIQDNHLIALRVARGFDDHGMWILNYEIFFLSFSPFTTYIQPNRLSSYDLFYTNEILNSKQEWTSGNEIRYPSATFKYATDLLERRKKKSPFDFIKRIYHFIQSRAFAYLSIK